MDKCNWTEDEDGIWHTDCGEAFFFDTGGPSDNKFWYCGFCGKDIEEKPFSAEGGWTLLELLIAFGCFVLMMLAVLVIVIIGVKLLEGRL